MLIHWPPLREPPYPRRVTIEQHLSTTQRTTLIIYAGLFMSLVTYVVVAFVLSSAPGDLPPPATSSISAPLTLAAIVAGGTSVLLPRWLLSDANIKLAMDKPILFERFARRPDGSTDPERLRALQLLDPASAKPLLAAQRWTLSVILGAALADAVAICGLILTIISRDPSRIFPFVAAAALLTVSHFPRLAPVIERAKQLQRL